MSDIVVGCNAARVEGTHGKLRARFADGLRRDDADGFAQFNRIAAGHVFAVALGADAVTGFAGQNASDVNLFDACRFDGVRLIGGDHLVGFGDNFAGLRIDYVVQSETAVHAFAEAFDNAVVDVQNRRYPRASGVAAIRFSDDNVLSNVDQTTGKITGVCCF